MITDNCAHCSRTIGRWEDGRWMHDHESGPDAHAYCGDEYGTSAEPYKDREPYWLRCEKCFLQSFSAHVEENQIALRCNNCARTRIFP